MNLIPALSTEDLGALFELDADGTVFYSRLRKNKLLFHAEENVVGSNFFDDVAPFENVDEFRQRFRHFVKSADTIENFNFDFRYEENNLPVRVMLVRVSETGFYESTKFIIVDIRKL